MILYEATTIPELLVVLHVRDRDELLHLVRLGRQAMRFGSNLLEHLECEVDAYGYVVDVKLRQEPAA